MIHKRTPLRPGMTAIAAVFALSSTPLFAQSADAAASADTPVLVSPPPVQAAAPVVTPNEAPQAVAPAPTAMRTASTPIVNTPDAANANSDDTPAATAPVTRTKTTQVHMTATTPRAVQTTAAAPIAPVAPVKVAKTKAVAATPNGTVQTTTTTRSAATPAAAAPSTQTVSNDELAAGIAGLGLIALAGGAFAYTRRTRRDDRYQDVDAVPEPQAAIPADPIVAPTGIVYADSPHTAVPAGFDLSRFGRHTQAAYRGPTADNPSLSLKRRLKRASFYDGRERLAAEGIGSTPDMPVQAPVASPAKAPRRTDHADHIVSRMRPQPSFRPVTA